MTQSTDVTTADEDTAPLRTSAGAHAVTETGAGADSATEADADADAGEASDSLVAEGDAAGDYLEQLLDILDYDGDIDLDVEGERAIVSIVGSGEIEKLVGEDGSVLDAVQELTRLAASAQTGQRSRLMLDIAGFRAARRTELTKLGVETATSVAANGEPVRLGVMNPFERKVVHDAVAGIEGVASSSEGEEPRRRVVVSPSE